VVARGKFLLFKINLKESKNKNISLSLNIFKAFKNLNTMLFCFFVKIAIQQYRIPFCHAT
jgi:hypothetical protein